MFTLFYLFKKVSPAFLPHLRGLKEAYNIKLNENNIENIKHKNKLQNRNKTKDHTTIQNPSH